MPKATRNGLRLIVGFSAPNPNKLGAILCSRRRHCSPFIRTTWPWGLSSLQDQLLACAMASLETCCACVARLKDWDRGACECESYGDASSSPAANQTACARRSRINQRHGMSVIPAKASGEEATRIGCDAQLAPWDKGACDRIWCALAHQLAAELDNAGSTLLGRLRCLPAAANLAHVCRRCSVAPNRAIVTHQHDLATCGGIALCRRRMM